MKKKGFESAEEVIAAEPVPETKAPDPVRFFFRGRQYNTATITEEEREYLRKFPEQLPYRV